jgi:hypothetical protein
VTGSGGGPRFDRPIFIVSTPRSGSTLLFETMEQAPGLFTTGRESHQLIEQIPGFRPAERGWSSNRLDATDAQPGKIAQLGANFLERVHDREGARPAGPFRLLEKTPKNALRVPFFASAFPDSLYIYLYRDVRETLGSMIEAWLTGKFRTYPGLPGWTGHPWSLLLVPGWQDLNGRSLPEIVAHQWRITTEHLLEDLSALPRDRLCGASYSELIVDPQTLMERLTAFSGLDWDRQLPSRLPPSKTTVSRPGPDKWRRFEEAIEAVMPIVEEADRKARTFLEQETAEIR